MLIKNLELKNIKSHQETGPLSFSAGVNAICGQTGAGKSTILEAIGFAVFDSSLYKQDFFVRERSKTGEIVVRIVDIADEREYEIVRPIKRGAPYIFDPEIQRKLVEGKVEVFTWLKEHLNLEPSTNLPALFEDAIGVPQGLFTSAFLENLSIRKNKFDPLLHVEDYEHVWENLRQSNSHLKNLLDEIHQDIARLEGQLEELPKRKKRKSSVQKELKKDKGFLKTNQDRYKIVQEEKSGFEEIKKKIDEANQKIGKIENNIANQKKQIKVAEKLLSEASKAQEIMLKTAKEHEKYLAAEEHLKGLEERNKEFQKLQGEFADVSKKFEIETLNLGRKEKDFLEYSNAQKELEKLEPLVESQEKIEENLEIAKANNIEHGNVQKSIRTENKTLQELGRELKEIQLGLEELKKRKNQLTEAKKQENEFSKEANKLSSSIQSLERSLEEIYTRQKLFSEGSDKEAVCPVCRQKIEVDQIENLQEHYQEEIEEINSKLLDFQAELKLKNDTLETIRKEIKDIEEKIENLPKKTQLNSVEKRAEKSNELLAELDKREKEISESKQQVIELDEKLKALEDPKSKKLHFAKIIRKHERIEEEIKDLNQHLKDLDQSRLNLVKQLEKFSGVEGEIEEQKNVLGETKASHNQYIKNENTAKSLEEREENKKQLESETKEAKKGLKEASNYLAGLNENFDEERYKQLEKEVTQVEKNIAKLEARITEKENQLAEIEKEILELTSLKEAKDELEKKRDRFVQAQEVLQFIREIIRQTGPYVKRALVHSISLEANRIFGDVINDHTLQLSWDEDYLIKIENQSNAREFSQLSGGEKMAAAIAVRLALLKQMTSIRVAFFDEPTTHLDEERRENLASQIADIKGFNQLFVISHDDTFEKETHNVIRVSKENGISFVETS